MVRVNSEIGRLRRVLLHEPGPEVDRMVPSMMGELLFDDILFGDRAREEHARLRRVMRLLGIEPVDAGRLLAEALEQEQAREWLVEVICDDLPHRLREPMQAAGPEELARMLVEGVRADRDDPSGRLFDLPPLPNWCFQRDPQVIVGGGVIFSAMATPARYREALLARTLFHFHPDLEAVEVLFDPLRVDAADPLFLGLHRPRLEGGDILVLSEQVLLVGESERSNHVGLHRLARALARREDGPRYMLVVRLPRRRAYMHLDTLFTMIDRDLCLVHAPVILGQGRETAAVAEIDLHAKDLGPRPVDSLLGALARRGLDLQAIPCGGEDPVDQQREQWTDGANCLALAPGVITLYERNRRTAEQLDRHGLRVIGAEDLLLGRAEVDLDGAERACLLLPSHEISRARGGPRCLTHPLLRDALPG
ncbi:MAG: arginine deiminase family protein [Acidobacteriota bacterium]|nr:arginine deiminase family protein [Acidobacteriota bacterium]